MQQGRCRATVSVLGWPHVVNGSNWVTEHRHRGCNGGITPPGWDG